MKQYNCGLSPGDHIEIIWGKEKQNKVQHATVVYEDEHYLVVGVGEYQISICKKSLEHGELEIRKMEEQDNAASGSRYSYSD